MSARRQRSARTGRSAAGARAAKAVGGSPVLSRREREVLQLIAEGLETAAIGEELDVSPDTVRTYLRSARSRLGARTRPHAVALALDRGIIDPVYARERTLIALAAGRLRSPPGAADGRARAAPAGARGRTFVRTPR